MGKTYVNRLANMDQIQELGYCWCMNCLRHTQIMWIHHAVCFYFVLVTIFTRFWSIWPSWLTQSRSSLDQPRLSLIVFDSSPPPAPSTTRLLLPARLPLSCQATHLSSHNRCGYELVYGYRQLLIINLGIEKGIISV